MSAADPILFDLDDIELEDIEPWQVDHVGAELAAARRRKGLSVETLAADLNIRAAFVSALEAGRYSDLPGLPYAIGYVRSIADHLGLDGEAFARKLKDEQGDSYVAPTLSLPEPEEIHEGGAPKALLAAVSIALGTLAYGGWILYSQPTAYDRTDIVAAAPVRTTPVADVLPGKDAPEEPAKAVHPGTAVTPTPVAIARAAAPGKTPEEPAPERTTTTSLNRIEAIAPAAATPPKPETPPVQKASLADAPIVLETRGLTWIHLKDAKGATVVAGAKKKGWRFTLPDKAGLRLTVGRANELVIVVGDKSLPPLRPSAAPVHNFVLDARKLRKQAEAHGR
ncbi:MAG: DUF4115 domain-containing protein [Bauldia litoralis]